MTTPQFKEFNLEHARAGAPYSLRNGQSATILHFGKERLIGMHTGTGGAEFEAGWTLDGAHTFPGHSGCLDLVMLPLGMCEGKPVWPGDVLVDSEGNKVVAAPHWPESLGDLCWPKSAPKWPQTSMTAEDLVIAANGGTFSGLPPPPYEWALRMAANAAIARAIEDGQVEVVPKEATVYCGDDPAEAAFWNFDARYKGYGEWALAPQSQRDAFKAEYRKAVADMVPASLLEKVARTGIDAGRSSVTSITYLHRSQTPTRVCGHVDVDALIASVRGQA